MAAPLPDNIPPVVNQAEMMSISHDDMPDIDINKSLPDETMKIQEDEIDTLKLQEAVDESLSIKEAKDPDIRSAIAIGVTLAVLASPLIIGVFALGGVTGFIMGVIKSRFTWDDEYDKEKKTQPYMISLPLYLLTELDPTLKKSIKSETKYTSMYLGTWLAMKIVLAAEPIGRFFEEQREKNKNKA